MNFTDFSNNSTIAEIYHKVNSFDANLLVVSKKRNNESIKEIYDMGFRDMGENRVQDLLEKKDKLPEDIRWHIIGNLQRNKVKYIAEFVHKIHSVDSIKLAQEINKQAAKFNRKIPILLQFKVAEEETKHGIPPSQKDEIINKLLALKLEHIVVTGIMGMATFTNDKKQLIEEFSTLKNMHKVIKSTYAKELPHFQDLSMGMSGDYELALEHGSTIVRLGSVMFNALK